MMAALCDLVRALSGAKLELRPMLPSPEESLGVASKVFTVQGGVSGAVERKTGLSRTPQIVIVSNG
jgi:hypothetical protein